MASSGAARVVHWGGISLARNATATITLHDELPPFINGRTELVQRLLAEKCELCGSTDGVQVHHIRAMKDLQRKGRAPKSAWVEAMAARRRKTLVVCRACHQRIHSGRAA